MSEFCGEKVQQLWCLSALLVPSGVLLRGCCRCVFVGKLACCRVAFLLSLCFLGFLRSMFMLHWRIP